MDEPTLLSRPLLSFLLALLACAPACVDPGPDPDDGAEPCPSATGTCGPTAEDRRPPAVAVDESDALAHDRVGHPPLVADDDAKTAEDEPLRLPLAALLANDVDPDGDRLAVVAAGDAVNATVRLTGDAVEVIPPPDFHGVAWFTYLVSDGRMQASGRVAVTVLPVADAPRAADARLELPPREHAIFGLKATDPDGDPLAFEILELPASGKLLEADGKLEYVPYQPWPGVDRLVYRATDGTLWSKPATITIVAAP